MSAIQAGKHVLFINTKTNESKCVKLPRKNPIFLKPFSFDANSLLGQHFDQTYRVVKHKLEKVNNGGTLMEPVVNCTKTNEFIKDDGSTQTLSQDDIESMKAKGINGQTIVETLVENSTSFSEKSEFSKAKWLKKKIWKHAPNITTKRPSIRMFCTSNTSKIRPDVLAKLLNNANIWNASKVLVVECKDDLLTSAITQRVHANGSVVQVFEQKLPHKQFCGWLDLSELQWSMLNYFPLKHLAKLEVEDEEMDLSQNAEIVDSEGNICLGKRKREDLLQFEKYKPILDHLRQNNFDSLVISTVYDPLPIVELLWKCIRHSGRMVIHTQYTSAAIECANYAKKQGCSELSLVDQWFREIQVLPGRTHPDMRMQTGGGVILTCTKLAEGIFEHGSNEPIKSSDEPVSDNRVMEIDPEESIESGILDSELLS